MQRGLIVTVFAPQSVLPQVPAMVTPEYNNGVSVQLKPFQFIQDFPDLGISKADTGIIAMDQLPGGGTPA